MGKKSSEKSGSTSKKRKKRRRRGRDDGSRRRGGVMMGMRTGFKDIADSVSGKEPSNDKYKWWGRVITVLLIAAAAGFLFSQL